MMTKASETLSQAGAQEAAQYLQPSHFIDSESAPVKTFTASALRDLAPEATDLDRAIALFEAVRDGIRYDPYAFPMDPDSYRASNIATEERAFCVPKAILLTASLRAAGIPAAVGFADVRNHLNTPKLTELMGTDLFIYHGYVQLWLGDKAFKVTPAFNMELCERFGVKPLIFDGTGDALFHEFNTANQRHMEYVNDRGIFFDVPFDDFLQAFRDTYPRMDEFVQHSAEGSDAKFAAAG